MATLTITNNTAADIYLGDIYAKVPASGSVTVTREQPDLSRMQSLQSYLSAGSLSVSVAYSAAEQGSGLVDQSGVAASINANGVTGTLVLRVAFAGLVTGTADDVTVFALNTLPFSKMRVVDAWGYVSAGNGVGVTLGLYTATLAGGTKLWELDASTTGRIGATTSVTASSKITNSSTVGLFIHRSDRAVAGEVIIALRSEV